MPPQAWRYEWRLTKQGVSWVIKRIEKSTDVSAQYGLAFGEEASVQYSGCGHDTPMVVSEGLYGGF